MVQKIETGGTSSTSTPMFRFLTNELLPPSEARHITHWAKVESVQRSPHKITIAVIATIRIR